MITEVKKHKGDIWGVKELASFLRISPVTLYRSLERGDIPCRKVGNQYRFYRPAVEDWLSFPLKANELSLYFKARDMHAEKYGLGGITMGEIDREIAAVRKAQKKRKKKTKKGSK